MERIKSVDVFRVMAIMAVVVIHTRPFYIGQEPTSVFDPGLILDQLARFAVPFFFAMSGYFWSAKIASQNTVWRTSFAMCRRIALIFIFWTVIYLIERALQKYDGTLTSFAATFIADILYLGSRPITMAVQGSKSHLWFLPALLSCVALSAIFVARRWERSLVVFALILFAIGLCGAAYTGSPLGFSKNYNFRNGPFFGMLFFVMGRVLFRIKARPSWLATGFLFVLVGTVCQFAELAMIHAKWNTPLTQDFVISTILTGLGVSMIALSNRRVLHFAPAARVGPLILGVYALHFLFIDIIGARHQWSPWYGLNELLYVLVVFALSIALTWLMAQNRYTRPVVA